MTSDSQNPTPPSPAAGWLKVIASAKPSLRAAAALLCIDVILSGGCIVSALVCPIWFLVSVVKNSIRKPGLKSAFVRAAIPALTLGIVHGNMAIQREIAMTHAQRIIKACEDFQAANGRYPRKLDELVPQYLPSIPIAKLCLTEFQFSYYNPNEAGLPPILWWCEIFPFGTKSTAFKPKSGDFRIRSLETAMPRYFIALPLPDERRDRLVAIQPPAVPGMRVLGARNCT